MTGIIDRHGQPPDSHRDALNGWCVPLYWDEVQPTASVWNWEELYDNLDNVQGDERLRVRLYAGIHSPRWVMDRAGMYSIPSIDAICPAWWRSSFLDAYEELMHGLAGEIDGDDRLAEVVLTGPCTEFAEPFIRQREDQVAVEQMYRLGWTRDRDRQSISACIDIHYEAFKRTFTSLAANPYQDLGMPGGQADLAFTLDVCEEFRSVLGGLAVTGNDSIRWPPQENNTPGQYPEMHEWIRNAGPPIAYQTATWEKVGDLLATLEWAVGQGCNAVEPPTQYKRELTAEQLAPHNEALIANARNLAGI